jgi:hypothetical protein
MPESISTIALAFYNYLSILHDSQVVFCEDGYAIVITQLTDAE